MFHTSAVASGGLNGAIPSSDPFETTFTEGQRNIFRQAFQKRADISLVKLTPIKEKYSLRFSFDVYNLTNTTSLDVPGNEVTQNADYNPFPDGSLTPLPTGCKADGSQTNTSFYALSVWPGHCYPHDRKPAADPNGATFRFLAEYQ